MTTQYKMGRSFIGTIILTAFAALLGMAVLVFFLHQATAGPLAKIATLLSGRSTSIQTSVPVVVERIQHLNRLETVVYSLDTIVEGDRSTPLLPDVLGGDKLVMIVHGQSIAGVDLSQLKPEDVHVSGHTIHVNLPISQVFVTTIDNQHTKVYARETGLFVPVDPNLESQVRAKAEDQLRQAALDDGILDVARKNARATVSALLYSLGFQQVDVQ